MLSQVQRVCEWEVKYIHVNFEGECSEQVDIKIDLRLLQSVSQAGCNEKYYLYNGNVLVVVDSVLVGSINLIKTVMKRCEYNVAIFVPTSVTVICRTCLLMKTKLLCGRMNTTNFS